MHSSHRCCFAATPEQTSRRTAPVFRQHPGPLEPMVSTVVTTLVIEHQPRFRDALVRILTASLGFRVVAAVGTLVAGLRCLRTDSPDLAIIDRDAPDGDALSLLPLLARLAPHTRIVLMAAVLRPRDIEIAARARVRACVSKTRRVQDLRCAFRSVAAGLLDDRTGPRVWAQPGGGPSASRSRPLSPEPAPPGVR